MDHQCWISNCQCSHCIMLQKVVGSLPCEGIWSWGCYLLPLGLNDSTYRLRILSSTARLIIRLSRGKVCAEVQLSTLSSTLQSPLFNHLDFLFLLKILPGCTGVSEILSCCTLKGRQANANTDSTATTQPQL